MTTKLFSLLTLAGACQLQPRANDWPQWRGPHRDGISPETGLLQEWRTGGPKQLWVAKNLGSGYSTPSVVGNSLYILANDGLDNESIKALSVENGRPLWSTRLGKVGSLDQKPSYPGARSTPPSMVIAFTRSTPMGIWYASTKRKERSSGKRMSAPNSAGSPASGPTPNRLWSMATRLS